jgi:P4 family phage/plasmid primase-like protien
MVLRARKPAGTPAAFAVAEGGHVGGTSSAHGPLAREPAPEPECYRLAADYLQERELPSEIAQRAGIHPAANAKEAHPGFKSTPGLVIPYFDPWTGARVTYSAHGTKWPLVRVRYLETGTAKGFFQNSKPRRFDQPSGSPPFAYFAPGGFLDWPLVLSDPKRHLLLVEGEIKALSACAQGIATIALAGVWNFIRDGVLLPELEQVTWQGRRVYVVFDSDLVANPNVEAAERRVGDDLTQRGAIVHFARLPRLRGVEKTGLDDFLRAHGNDARKQLLELLENTPATDPGKLLILEGTDVEIADSVLRDLADKYLSNTVFCEGDFYAYGGTHWRPLPDHELRNAILRYDKTRFKAGAAGIVKLSRSRVDSVLSIMRDRATDPDFFVSAPAGINCASGFIVFDDGGRPHLEAHDREHRQRHCLPGSWDPGAPWEGATLLGALVQGCFGADPDREDKIALIGEICGVAALGIGTRMRARKAIVAFGPSAENGKSEMLAMVRGLLPSDAVSAVSPTRFCDERMLIKLVGKLLNACDELGTTQAIISDTFKSVVTGEPVMAKELYKPAVSFAPTALNIFATNVLPSFHGGFDRGVQRRLLVLPFNRSIPKDEQIAEIGKRIAAEEMDALLAFAVEGAARVIRNGQCTEPESCRAALREWIFNADPVLAWLVDRTNYVEGYRMLTKQAYADFREWAETEGIRTDRLPGAPTFVSRLLAHDGRITTARDSRARYVVGVKLRPTQSQWAAISHRDDLVPKVVAISPASRWGQ